MKAKVVVAEDEYRNAATAHDIESKEVEFNIGEACISPQTNEYLQQIHKAHRERESTEQELARCIRQSQEMRETERALTAKMVDLLARHENHKNQGRRNIYYLV